MKNDFERYHKALAYIDSLSNLPLFAEYMSGVTQPHPEIYLKRMRYFLKLLGNPEKGFKFVHVTGTAGKGTVGTQIFNMLSASGKVSGLFTSPFVVSPIEKIQVGNLYIAPDEFADLVEKIKPAIDAAYISGRFGRPSHFEIYFAVALLYFKDKKCEWVVLEVGCGGCFDATNIIRAPEVSIITRIDYDHTEILGNTLKKIARDKAGIIKKGSRFFTTETRPALCRMFSDISKKQGAIYEKVFVPEGEDANICLASRVGEFLGISKNAIRNGIRKTLLPARFEIVGHKPLIILDGAHNGIKISRAISHLAKERFKKLFLIISIADNKNSYDILKRIIPLADEVLFTRFATRDRKPAPPARLLKESRRYLKSDTHSQIFLDASDALVEACRKTRNDDCIFVTGSFFLAGELRKIWFPEEKILKHRRSF
ncbi:MAG: FolC bifunctional protein [Candidatus Magasanikbacteria bacterium GW2011_GWA2_46_17]|uniref:tetrahydrofolate synthase n=1 Tax=Candidatus Magasanikbacteria bacterium GW2011_GWA2_46_17 TaxID=1619042 RepID=A0A0G1NY08_9BACT|nr:MAG: FolC bifunctional protein [Candidatus Magasanikbacteria bacterium GW2011_GWA2_46_17]